MNTIVGQATRLSTVTRVDTHPRLPAEAFEHSVSTIVSVRLLQNPFIVTARTP